MLDWLFRARNAAGDSVSDRGVSATAMAPDSDLLKAALRHHDAGRLTEAESLYRQLLAGDPRNVDALHFLGVIAHQRGDHAQAVELISGALAQYGANASAHNNLGCALRAQDKLAQAAASFQKALELTPNYFDAHVNLGRTHQAQGNLARAASSFRAALQLRPAAAATQSELAWVLVGLGQLEEAIACYEAALQAQPELFEARYNMAVALRDLGRRADAIAQVEKVIQSKPGLAQAHYLLGHLHGEADRYEAALSCFERVIQLDPGHAEARWSQVMAELPGVYGVHDDPRRARAAFVAGIGRLEHWFDSVPVADASVAVGVQQPFRLAYQEENNIDLLKRYGNLCVRLMASWQDRYAAAAAATAEHAITHAIRVGIVSGHFRDHSVWHAITKGWVHQFDRTRFVLAGFNLGPPPDEESSKAVSGLAHFAQGPRDLPQWLQAIQAWRPDVLIYPEIGMEPVALKLASLRLAPVQAVSWGHPETTGLPSMDYYLSADGLEPPGAQAHYSEKLVLLPHLGSFFEQRRFAPAVAEGEDGGDDPAVPMLLCAGVPFKYAPQNDRVLVEIARRLEKCRLVFFMHPNREQSEKLSHRLASAFGAQGLNSERYVTFVPWLSKPRFHRMLARATLLLDTIGFSGFNTALHAVGRGLPIVAWEGRFMRGRFASGILDRMGLRELVVASQQDYIALAVRLATDAGYRAAMSQQIGQRSQVLFEDLAPVRTLEQFLIDATKKAR
jgi:predicted O-linked N-acetylglucosamine transferase (SPINDLY family)